MNTIHTSQSIRRKDELTAANDINLSMSDAYLLTLINKYIDVNGSFTLTGDEISSKWNKFTKRTANRCVSNLSDNGYIKVVEDKELFYTTRTISTLDESSKVKVKPSKVDTIKKKELFSQFWEAYNVKKGRKKAEDKFLKLSLEDCKKCVKAVSSYVASTPDVTYRKHVTTWLNGECWNDEIVIKTVVLAGSERAKAEIERTRKELAESDLLEKEKQQRFKDRFNKYGWQRPFPSYKDIAEKMRIEANGFEANIEDILTKRLKREGNKYSK
tara:strand:- start:4875 stop:5687 length:813 start_codon:yes stop_codon:yes gene_type:complete